MKIEIGGNVVVNFITKRRDGVSGRNIRTLF